MRVKQALVGVVAAAVAFTALPATGAYAINRATPCPRDDYMQIYNEGTLCFANAGSIATRIYNVWGAYSGNNRSVVASQGFADESLARYEGIAFATNRFVTRVQIL